MFSQPETARDLVELSGMATPNVLYIGTASYDKLSQKHKQTHQLAALGCEVRELAITYLEQTQGEMRAQFHWADLVLVSGGNTFFATRRWEHLGVDKLLLEAGRNGTVLAGGSAGGIVWFNGGHSGSMSPTTYKNAPGPIYNPNLTKAQLSKSWAYIRTVGLGLLDGLFCPHYDVRADSFLETMRAHSGEYGIALDNWAVLRIENGKYRVVARANQTGSHLPNGTFATNLAQGFPGAWQMYINFDGELVRKDVPVEGSTTDLFRKARYISQDQQLPVAALQNPDDGVKPN